MEDDSGTMVGAHSILTRLGWHAGVLPRARPEGNTMVGDIYQLKYDIHRNHGQ